MSIKLLPWQKRGLQKCIEKFQRARDFLCVATPGSGKTIFALASARRMWEDGAIRRLIVVVPSAALVDQWVQEAHNTFGFDLEANGDQASQSNRSYDGLVITYSRLAGAAQGYRALCSVPTLVIFDEIHHAEREEGHWGRQVVEAFGGNQIYRLSLSGTPFRTRGKITFLEYIEPEPGKLRAKGDHYYTVSESVEDRVCRRVIFPTIDVPHIEWRKGDHSFSASLTDELPEDIERARNQAALDVDSEAVRLLISRADQKLREVRKSHAAAGALLLAASHRSAQRLCEVVKKITGEIPRYLSEDLNAEDANALIRAFDKSGDPWLVSVRRVSEGVDIKRLRVLAYLTNIETPSFFRQAVGRVVRYIKGIDPQDAYVFVLAREPFLTMAAELEKEQDLPIPVDDQEREPSGGSSGEQTGEPPVLTSCVAEIGDTILTGGAAAITPDELNAVLYLADLYERSPEQIALDMRDARTDLTAELPVRPTEPKSERMKRKTARANRLAFAVGASRGYPKEEAARRVHSEWKSMARDHHWQDQMDELELDRKLAWLKTELQKAKAA